LFCTRALYIHCPFCAKSIWDSGFLEEENAIDVEGEDVLDLLLEETEFLPLEGLVFFFF
jgi:hypothetical protein